MNETVAVFAGSFDPVTFGHLDIIRRGARLFDRLIVVVGTNARKSGSLFTQSQRIALLREELDGTENIEVEVCDGLTVEFARSMGATVLLRSVRSVSDLDSESAMAAANRTLAPEIETVLLLSRPELAHISSGLVRECVQAGAKDLSEFVPGSVSRVLKNLIPGDMS